MKWATSLTEKSDAKLILNRPYLSAIRVSPGIHFVNRLGYLLTNEERIGDEIQYLYE